MADGFDIKARFSVGQDGLSVRLQELENRLGKIGRTKTTTTVGVNSTGAEQGFGRVSRGAKEADANIKQVRLSTIAFGSALGMLGTQGIYMAFNAIRSAVATGIDVMKLHQAEQAQTVQALKSTRDASGLTALAIIPCIILTRAERAARRAGADAVPDEALAEAVAA